MLIHIDIYISKYIRIFECMHTDIHKYRHVRNGSTYIRIIYSCRRIYAYLYVYAYIHAYLYETTTCTANGLAEVNIHPVSIIELKGKASGKKMNIKYIYEHTFIYRDLYIHVYVWKYKNRHNSIKYEYVHMCLDINNYTHVPRLIYMYVHV
jgi:hypothetical protein